MNGKEMLAAAVTLIIAAVVNYAWAVLATSYNIPVRIEFIIVAYCFLIIVLSLKIRDAVAIGLFAGVLTLLANPGHLGTIFGGQETVAGTVLAFSNLVSEPVGAAGCVFAVAYIATGKIRAVAPFTATFLATGASGLVYFLTVIFFSPDLIATQPEWAGRFAFIVLSAAILNAVLVQIVVMVAGGPVRAALAFRTR